MWGEIYERFEVNLTRVNALVSLYEELDPGGSGRRPVNSTDILRAATVMLHATVEDVLRGLALWQWPRVGNPVPASVALAGSQLTKFTLDDLTAFRSKRVGEVLRESIEEYLNRATYNNTTQVAQLLTSVGVDPENVNSRFADIDEMMKRRHHIVHQADRNLSQGTGHHAARSITTTRVEIWVDAVLDFVTDLDGQLS